MRKKEQKQNEDDSKISTKKSKSVIPTSDFIDHFYYNGVRRQNIKREFLENTRKIVEPKKKPN